MTAPQQHRPEARPHVRVDVRRRVSLGKVTGVKPGDLFFIEVGADGDIRLTPAVSVPLGALALDD